MPDGYTCLLPGSPSFLRAATTSDGRRLAAILRRHRYHKGDPLLWLGVSWQAVTPPTRILTPRWPTVFHRCQRGTRVSLDVEVVLLAEAMGERFSRRWGDESKVAKTWRRLYTLSSFSMAPATPRVGSGRGLFGTWQRSIE
jgi:hypothetical protein